MSDNQDPRRLKIRTTHAAMKEPLRLKPKQLARYIAEHDCLAHLSREQREVIRKIIIEVETEGHKRRYFFRPSDCLCNAQMLALRCTRIMYHEGVCVDGDDAVHHGWNSIDGTEFDITAAINIGAMLERLPNERTDTLKHLVERHRARTLLGKKFDWDALVGHVFGGGYRAMLTEDEVLAFFG